MLKFLTLNSTHKLEQKNASLQTTPPPLAGSPPPPKPEPVKATTAAAPKAPEKPNWQRLIDWATEDKPKEQKKKEIPPFDLRDIPKAMEAMGWKIAAKLAQRWLDGEYYLAPITLNEKLKEVEGYYKPSMVDTDTIKMDWLLGYEEVENKYKSLLTTIRTDNAIKALAYGLYDVGVFDGFFQKNPSFSGSLDTRAYCGGDIQKLHKQFQFQHIPISMLAGVDIGIAKTVGMTELMAALAGFGLYVAVARADVTRQVYCKYNTPKGNLSCVRRFVSISHIYVYAKDSYSFYDFKRKSSQYLGHWNKKGVILMPNALAPELAYRKNKRIDFEAGNHSMPLFTVDIGGRQIETDIYYPIRNRDYMNYRELHKRGGDFLIFSDLKPLKLSQPLQLDMGEVCVPFRR